MLPYKLSPLLLLTFFSLEGCAPPNFHAPGPLPQESAYNALFPQWAEMCAVSQISKKPGYGADIAGGPGGHAVLFLHGACLDPSSPYPVLKACPQGETGVSMNAHFVNANWVGVPGRMFFYNGLLKPEDGLTREAYQATKKSAKQQGLYSAISFRDWALADRPSSAPAEDWKYEVSIGTDYAVSYGRARYCARLPVTSTQMTQIVNFLNSRNALYHYGPKTFETNVMQDNCNHLIHNALAATNFWHELPVHQFILKAALTFPVPKNEVVNLLDRTKQHDLGDLHALYHDPLTRQTLLHDNWLPNEPGVILDSNTVHDPNDVYHTNLSLIFYDDPILGHYNRAFRHYLAQPRYHDLRANLLWYRAQYARVASERQPLQEWLKKEPAGFAAFYNAYYVWLADQQALVEKGLNLLSDASPISSALPVTQPETLQEGPAHANAPQNPLPEEKQ